ncbi:hypothetical protein Tco_1301518 [Tanacetum coccineum]
MPQPMQNPEDNSDPTTAMNKALALLAKAFKIANRRYDIRFKTTVLMVDDNVGNQFRENAVQNVKHLVGQNAVQNQDTHNVGNQNGLSVVPGITNQHGNGNVVVARAEGAYDEIEKVTSNCNLQDNMQQASTSGTHSVKAPIYESNESAEVLLSVNLLLIHDIIQYAYLRLWSIWNYSIPIIEHTKYNKLIVIFIYAVRMEQSGGK